MGVLGILVSSAIEQGTPAVAALLHLNGSSSSVSDVIPIAISAPAGNCGSGKGKHRRGRVCVRCRIDIHHVDPVSFAENEIFGVDGVANGVDQRHCGSTVRRNFVLTRKGPGDY